MGLVELDDESIYEDRTHLGMLRFRVPDDLRHLQVDSGMWDGIQHYVFLGLHPGSFGEALLLGDYDLAVRRGHAIHRVWRDEYQMDVAANLIQLVQWLPDVCHGTPEKIQRWQQLNGLQGQPHMRLLFKLAL